MASQINAIDKQSVHKLCSGQVVLDLATAVKELVENSIDAGATSVEVKFKDNGITGFEVVDNGSGIDPANYNSLALKHYTSKLVEFTDLERVETFGFRGEALSSLCALSNLTVITSTKDQEPMGVKLEYDMNGVLVSQTPIARSAGTTLVLSNIFYSLPVRQKEFKRNIKKEYGNALTILQAYSIISTNVRISVSNQTGQKSSIKVMSTGGNKDLKANIANVFGAKLTSGIIPFKVDLSSIFESGTIEGYISKPEWGVGRSSSDRQYYFVNGRPCLLPKIAKSLNEVYRNFISKQYPVVIADLKVPTNGYEVNLSPDKRTILVHHENKITEAIIDQLKNQWESSRSTFELNPLLALGQTISESKSREENSIISQSSSCKRISIDIDSDNDSIRNNSSIERGSSTSSRLESLISKPFSKSGDSIGHTNSKTTTIENKKCSLPTGQISDFQASRIGDIRSFALPDGDQYKPKQNSGLKRSAPINVTSSLMKYMSKKPKFEKENNRNDEEMSDVRQEIVDEIIDENLDTSSASGALMFEESNSLAENSDILVDTPEYIEHSMGIKSFSRFRNTKDYVLTVPPIPIESLKSHIKSAPSNSQQSTISDSCALENASFKNTTDDKKAAEALSRVISKPDFARMQVLGQFNLGFIITSLDDHDLYIVDQHAADEKYNFETLQKTTQLTTQKLIRPQLLDLTAAEELIVMDNVEIFEANGFGVEILPDNEPTKRIRLVSHMTSKNTMFDKLDFSELVSLINESPGEMVHCSRIRSMFASRACHKATRIGDSLTKKQMKTIVDHMGEIEQPWNCPHGRPTMRHLLSYNKFKSSQPALPKRSLSFKGSLFSK